MPPPVRIVFVAEGQAAVNNAFQSVAKQAQQLARAQVRGAKEGARETIKAANDGAKAQVKAAKTAQQELERARISSAKAAVKASQESERAYDREMKAAVKSADAIVKASERRAAAERKANEASARTAMRSVGGMSRGVTAGVGRAARSTMGTVSGIAGGLGLAGGTYMVGNAISEAIDLKRQAALLSNATASPGMAGRDPAALVKTAQGVAGFKTNDVMSAMQTVAARAGGGKGLAAFEKDINDVAKTAAAAGVSIEDMGSVYAAALNAGVAPGDEMRQLMIDLVQQGKAGAVEFKDLSTELARLGGAGRKFGSGADMLRKVSGLAQIAVESKVSPEESRSAVVDMLREMTMAEKITGMTQLGAKVAGEGGKLNDPAAIMADTIHGIESGKQFGHGKRQYGGTTGEGKLGAYGYLFTGASNDIAQNLRETYLKAGGGEAGKSAVMSRISEASTGGKEKMTSAQRDKEYAVVAGTESAQIGKAMKDFNTKITELLPAFTKLIGPATQLATGFANLAVWVSQNPFTGLGALFAANLGKELAAAQLSNVFKTGIETILSGKGGGAGGNMAALATIAITATAVYLTGTKVIDEYVDAQDKKGKDIQSKFWEASNLSRSGVKTPEELAKAKNLLSELQTAGGPGKDEPSTLAMIGSALGPAAPILAAIDGLFKERGQGVAKGEELEATTSQLDSAIKLAEAAGLLTTAASNMSGSLANPKSPERGP